MTFKHKTIITHGEHLTLQHSNIKKVVSTNYEYLIESIQERALTEDQLIKIIMDKQKINETAAGFELAGFVVEYQEFLDFGKTLNNIID